MAPAAASIAGAQAERGEAGIDEPQNRPGKSSMYAKPKRTIYCYMTLRCGVMHAYYVTALPISTQCGRRMRAIH
jgi:hypothetical protein